MLRHGCRLGAALAVAIVLLVPAGAHAAYQHHGCGTRAAFSQVAVWGTLTVAGISCRYGTRLALRHTREGGPVGGFRCRLTAKHGTENGGDPFVRYRCERGGRWFTYMLVN